ncbi:hypothetical protein [Flaviflexus equikiangi]|uniref:Helix-turn-helix domain-containing protein n=1 Tax=Flaviflexus equikiangi TaxID=2758573 RepID=A0ABS2TFS8_9ACTO|nr:hypothetical protein [Flaviflexus equikiangi]MBM9432371.1 hypothetical protein [Flaviflexus equikiangi]
MTRIAFSRKEAAEAVGLSGDTLRRAIEAGDLHTYRPHIGGREINKELILATELERWVTNSPRT